MPHRASITLINKTDYSLRLVSIWSSKQSRIWSPKIMKKKGNIMPSATISPQGEVGDQATCHFDSYFTVYLAYMAFEQDTQEPMGVILVAAARACGQSKAEGSIKAPGSSQGLCTLPILSAGLQKYDNKTFPAEFVYHIGEENQAWWPGRSANTLQCLKTKYLTSHFGGAWDQYKQAKSEEQHIKMHWERVFYRKNNLPHAVDITYTVKSGLTMHERQLESSTFSFDFSISGTYSSVTPSFDGSKTGKTTISAGITTTIQKRKEIESSIDSFKYTEEKTAYSLQPGEAIAVWQPSGQVKLSGCTSTFFMSNAEFTTGDAPTIDAGSTSITVGGQSPNICIRQRFDGSQIAL